MDKTQKIMAKLLYKLHITGEIIVQTGLHIGGSEVDLDIGGIDKEVIKVKQGKNKVPYIPGSSLKGKLRALLGRSFGYKDHNADDKEVLSLFAGTRTYRDKDRRSYTGKQRHPKDRATSLIPSRLIVRDAYAVNYQLEDKAENTINRATGVANPRHLERVTRDTVFEVDLILDVYKDDPVKKHLETLDHGFQILKRDYLGGSGTRGYGKVDIQNLSIQKIVFKETGAVEMNDYTEYTFKTND